MHLYASEIPFSAAIQNGAAGVLCAIVLVALALCVYLVRKIAPAIVRFFETAGEKAGAVVDKNTEATNALVQAIQTNARDAADREHASTLRLVEAIGNVDKGAIERHGAMREHVTKTVQEARDALRGDNK